MKYNQRHHGLFAAFAPADDPVIAVGVVAEHVCHGGSGAGPIARAVIKAYLEKYWPDKYGEKVLQARLKEKGRNPVIVPSSADEEEDIIPDLPSVPTPNQGDKPEEKPEE